MSEIPSQPLYKVNQRVQERKKAYLGITSRDVRSHSKRKIEGKLKYRNERRFTIVGEPTLKTDKLKRRSWIYPIVEDGYTKVHYKTQGMLKPVEE
tara:strand:+ start:1272 stop:1556 length:285 start_codon:yes stop_codon:yes gene_type:complete